MGLLKRAENCRLKVVDERDERCLVSNKITDNDGWKELGNKQKRQVMNSFDFEKEVKKTCQKGESQRVVLGIQSSEATDCDTRLRKNRRENLSNDTTLIKSSLSSGLTKKIFRGAQSGKPGQDYPVKEKVSPQIIKKDRSDISVLAKRALSQKCPVVNLEVCYYANCHHWRNDQCTHPESLTKI